MKIKILISLSIAYFTLCLFLSIFTQKFTPLLPVYFLQFYGFSPLFFAGFSLSAALASIVFLSSKRLDTYGAAHFASNREIKKMGLFSKTGLILGIKHGQYIRTSDPLSVLVYAPPGSGKTSGVIIPTLLSCSNSVIAYDPKGELYRKTSSRRGEFSQVIKFNPSEPGSARWNPLSKKELPDSWEAKQAVVDRIANALITDGKYSISGDDFWVREARSLFSFYALYLVYKQGETSFSEILKEMLDFEISDQEATPQNKIVEIINSDVPDRVKVEGAALAAKAYKEFSGALSTCKSYLQVFLDDMIAQNTSTSDFKIKDFRKNRTTLYLTVKTSDQSRLKPLFSLFFELATLQLTENEPEKEDLNVTFLLDEFKRLNRLQEVLELPSISRSYRVNAVFVVQSVSQIKEIYGAAGLEQLKSTCAYHLVFTQNEYSVAEEVSKAIGYKTDIKRSKSSSSSGGVSLLDPNRQSKNTGTSETQEGKPLIKPQEVMSLPKNKVLVLVQGNFQVPVKATICFYFKNRIMRKLTKETS